MANIITNPVPSYWDGSGNPLSGGTLSFYVTGTSTATDTYSDNTLTTPNANPLTLNSRGEPDTAIFLDPAVTYKIILKDSDGVTIWTRDPVVDPSANVSAAFQVYTGDPNGNVAGNAGSVGGSGASAVWDVTNDLLYVCTTSGTASTAVWTQVGASLAGQVTQTGVISPAQITADQNNYEPTGLSTASVLRLNSDAVRSITGLVAQPTGTLLTIHNTGSFNITLVDESGSSTAANRFALEGDVAIYPDTTASLRYDGVSSRWRITSAPAQNASDTVAGRVEYAVQSEMETGTSNVLAVTPGRQHFHPGHPKCWAFVTVSGGTPTLQTSYNITSITDTGVGQLTITIATDFSSANWAPFMGARGSVGQDAWQLSTQAAGSILLTNSDIDVGGNDPAAWSFMGMGDLA